MSLPLLPLLPPLTSLTSLTSLTDAGALKAARSGSDLARATADALGPHGALALADPGFVEREPQLRLADAMARAIAERATLVAEAGTGVGKTFAYLCPCCCRAAERWCPPPPRACRTSSSCATCRACEMPWACRCAWHC